MAWQQHLNSLVQETAALDLVGMPRAHAPAFKQVARAQQCVISSRELGKVGTGLVEEGYDSKGFRVKSKTCNFGPMAGFVCVNPNYSKKGLAFAETQQHYVETALRDEDHVGWSASTEQICISDQRLAWLRSEDSVHVEPIAIGGDGLAFYGMVAEPAPVTYLLAKERHRVSKEMVWHLYTLTASPSPLQIKMSWSVLKSELKAQPILALVNPYPAYEKGHYKNCCCGDYDLFGVWPRRRQKAKPKPGVLPAYDPRGEDRRIAGMPGTVEERDRQAELYEERRLGNISDRIHTIAQMVNSVLPAPPGARPGQRDMLHHSDEGGRPVITAVELPVIAFVPNPQLGQVVHTVGAGNISQMQSLVKLCAALGYMPILNVGWLGDLGDTAALGDTGDARGWQTPLDSNRRSR
jgi:hypothetical protein